MADRSSANLFSMLFNLMVQHEEYLPKDGSVHPRVLEFWKQAGEYDFSPYQMYCDDALMKLGLARHTNDSDGYPCTQYRNFNGKDWKRLY